MSASLPTKTAVASTEILEDRWPGYKAVDYKKVQGRVIVTLEPRQHQTTCPHCHTECRSRHSRQIRTAVDAPLFPHTLTIVRIATYRYRCACGHTCSDRPTFIEPRARLTNSMVLYAQQLLRLSGLTLKAVSQLTGLSWPTLAKLDKAQLKYCFEHVNLSNVRNIAIDEFSVHKNHKYATMIIDNDTGQALWLCRGKSQDAVRPFFQELQKRQLENNITSVSCDMNAAYPRLVLEYLPNACLIYDLFHVVAHFRSDVLKQAMVTTRQRVAERLNQEAQKRAKTGDTPVDKNQLRADIKKAHSSISGIDWIMVQHAEDLTKAKQEKLLQVMQSDNALLAALRPIAESIRELWKIKDQEEAQRHLKTLTSLLGQINKTYDFKPAKRFALMLTRRAEGIVRAGHFGFTTSRIEGSNNKVKVQKRVGYGFRDIEYFFLKVKSILPGKQTLSFYDRLKGHAIIKDRMWAGSWAPSSA